MLRPLESTLRELTMAQTREGAIARAGIEALRRMWASDDGRKVFAMLAMVAHPYASRVRENALDTGAADGRAEVVGCMISLASGGAIAPDLLTQTAPLGTT